MKSRPRPTLAARLSRLSFAALLIALPSMAGAQTPNSVTILTQPEQTVAGQNIKPASVAPLPGGPGVEVRDTLNNPLPGASVTVS